ncbi:hypothetical protein M9Y10_039602 [Tritrichomonas musculus]|uniref:Yippee domain-containing protein n=1 Tax=Tritrichomonas musculus TaxID=1915356 RepID=A0ABR2KCB1_9EUKA
MSNEQYCACQNICVNGTIVESVQSSNCKNHFTKLDQSNPIFQIHTGSIRIQNFGHIDVQVIGHHLVQVTCESCGKNLKLYASKNGAYCQFQRSFEMIICGSLPSKRILTSFVSQSIPKSMKPLFTSQNPNIDKFTIEPLYNSIENEEAAETHGEQENPVDSNYDFDLMFSSKNDPLIGSYAEVGEFARDNDFLVFLD